LATIFPADDPFVFCCYWLATAALGAVAYIGWLQNAEDDSNSNERKWSAVVFDIDTDQFEESLLDDSNSSVPASEHEVTGTAIYLPPRNIHIN
jgi:hypothetical protein